LSALPGRPVPADAQGRNALLGVLAVLLGAIGFSAKPTLVKLGYQYGVDVMTLLALRMLFSLPFFAMMALWSRGGGASSGLIRNDWLAVLGLGFIGYYLSSLLDFTGLQYVSAGLGRLILFLYPTLVVLLSAVLLKQPIRTRHATSLAISYGGIALVFFDYVSLGEDIGSIALGTMLVFSSAFTYAIYLVAGSRVVLRMGSMRFTAFASIVASFFVILHFALTHDLAALRVAHQVYWVSLVMAVFATVLPMWLVAEGLKRIGANRAALIACIGPVSTMVLSYFVLAEPITAVQLAGAALVLVGVGLVTIKPRVAA
jgi:drug/metabolite transporter (DMT)-like permease